MTNDDRHNKTPGAASEEKPVRDLSRTHIRDLRARAHQLKPVVMIGAQGLTDAVLREMDHALATHELIKVKLPQVDKTERQTIVKRASTMSGAAIVQTIGRIAVLYRFNPDK